MICGVFGLPRAGKSTFLTYLARRALQGKSLSVGHFSFKKSIGEFGPYKRVFCNFPLEGCYKLNFDDLGVYDFSESLILIDEIMLVCDSRDYKNFRSDLRDFLALHGHYKCDIVYCSQGYMDTDKRIRNLTERMFYLEKFGQFSRVRPIDKGFKIDEQINEGYYLAPPLSATYLYRKRYYKFFDSFAAPSMPVNPSALWDNFLFQYDLTRLQRLKVSINCLICRIKLHFSPPDVGQKQSALQIANKINQDSDNNI